MNYRNLFFLIWFCSFSFICSAQKNSYTAEEKSCVSIFIEFTKYVNNCIIDKADITDSTHLKYILLHYLFINKRFDSTSESQFNINQIPKDQLNALKDELQKFYSYIRDQENKSLGKNITAIPLRVSADKSIYNRLTSFQKQNTYIFYDKRYPAKTLGYVLFLPPIKNITTSPRIWAWTLMFKFGKYFFRSLTGDEGYEYLFEK